MEISVQSLTPWFFLKSNLQQSKNIFKTLTSKNVQCRFPVSPCWASQSRWSRFAPITLIPVWWAARFSLLARNNVWWLIARQMHMWWCKQSWMHQQGMSAHQNAVVASLTRLCCRSPQSQRCWLIWKVLSVNFHCSQTASLLPPPPHKTRSFHLVQLTWWRIFHMAWPDSMHCWNQLSASGRETERDSGEGRKAIEKCKSVLQLNHCTVPAGLQHTWRWTCCASESTAVNSPSHALSAPLFLVINLSHLKHSNYCILCNSQSVGLLTVLV